MRRSSLPCRLDVLALLIEINSSIGNWEPRGTSTVERLHQLAGCCNPPRALTRKTFRASVVGGSEQLGET